MAMDEKLAARLRSWRRPGEQGIDFLGIVKFDAVRHDGAVYLLLSVATNDAHRNAIVAGTSEPKLARFVMHEDDAKTIADRLTMLAMSPN
jgi:hypothetical protein